MKLTAIWLLSLLLIGVVVGPVSAQAETPTPVPTVPGLTRFSSGSRFLARVNVESLHVHRLPSQSAERVASLFKGEVVQVVSRSLDGSWFEAAARSGV